MDRWGANVWGFLLRSKIDARAAVSAVDTHNLTAGVLFRTVELCGVWPPFLHPESLALFAATAARLDQYTQVLLGALGAVSPHSFRAAPVPTPPPSLCAPNVVCCDERFHERGCVWQAERGVSWTKR